MSGPLNILMLLNEDVRSPGGGLGVHVREVSRRLAKNHNVLVIGVDSWTQEGSKFYWDGEFKQTDSFEYVPGKLRLLNVYNTNSFRFNAGVVNDMIRDHVFTENIIQHTKGEKFDIVHLHDCTLYKPGKYAQVLHGSKMVSTAHLSTIAIGPDRLHEQIARHYAEQELIMWSESEAVITVSKYYHEVVNALTFIDSHMIYNGVDCEPIERVVPEKKKRKTVGVLGRPTLQKGIDLMLKVAALCPDWDFEIVSFIPAFYESPNDEVVKLLKECALPNVRWHRYMNGDEKWAVLKGCDLAVMPSRHEPFGIAALEWMAAGVPLIVSNIDGLKEFCTPENSTPIAPSVEEIAWHIKTFKRDDLKVARAKETAREFTWERAVDKLESVYRGVMNGDN